MTTNKKTYVAGYGDGPPNSSQLTQAYHDERLGWIVNKHKEGLTHKQKTVYDIIKDFIKSNKYSPSYEEIKQLAGLHSKENVHRYIYQLINRGWLRNKKGRNRSLSLT